MKYVRKILLLCGLLVGCWLSSLHAQQGFVAAGGDQSGVGGSASYSVGQVDYIVIEGASGTISQGLQQPFEFWVVTGIEIKGIELAMAVYPNPTAELVNLRVESEDFQALSYILTDINGRQLATDAVSESLTTISLAQYAQGSYLLNVMENGRPLKGFKIIKNQ